MNPSNDKNWFSGSQKPDDPEEYHRNPSPGISNHKALTVIQDLSWASFFPLFAVYLKYGPTLIYYQSASRGGLRLGSLLSFFGFAVSSPLKINDLYYCDTPHVSYWNIQYQVVKACRDQLNAIEVLVKEYLPKCTTYIRRLLATNVTQVWQLWLLEVLLLRVTAKQLGEQEAISHNRVILISRYASLLKILNLDSLSDNDVSVSSHPNQNRAMLYPLATVVYSFREVLFALFRSLLSGATSSVSYGRQFRVGVAAAWGIEGMDKAQTDDLFWWRNNAVVSGRLVYMFEREDIQPTRDRVEQAKNLGIESVALNPRFLGDHPNLLIKNKQNKSLLMSLRNFCFTLKLAGKTFIGDEFSSAVLSLVSWHYFLGKKLSEIYKTLNLKGVFHFDEAGMDIISLASVMSDSTRIGTHWASQTGINLTSCRRHQVYFLWGSHDAQLVLDAGSMSRSLLIAGCFLSDHSNEGAHQGAQGVVKEMRKRGVRYILTLFDNSTPSPEFYRFFLQWLVDDSHLGLLIKSKGTAWDGVCSNGLDGLIDRAKKTNRIYVLDHRSSPADAALLSDFAVGVTSISALVVSALHGARVIFLDYGRIDQGP